MKRSFWAYVVKNGAAEVVRCSSVAHANKVCDRFKELFKPPVGVIGVKVEEKEIPGILLIRGVKITEVKEVPSPKLIKKPIGYHCKFVETQVKAQDNWKEYWEQNKLPRVVQDELCPRCGSSLVYRINKKTRHEFKSCIRFPACKRGSK